eukprot:jgi/Tetstr1/464768/TSEL_009514.t1
MLASRETRALGSAACRWAAALRGQAARQAAEGAGPQTPAPLPQSTTPLPPAAIAPWPVPVALPAPRDSGWDGGWLPNSSSSWSGCRSAACSLAPVWRGTGQHLGGGWEAQMARQSFSTRSRPGGFVQGLDGDKCAGDASSCGIPSGSDPGGKEGQGQGEGQQGEPRGRLAAMLAHPDNNAANWISMARGASGPLIAWWIVSGAWAEAAVGVGLAGLSDWADGAVARRYGLSSALGSWLDPAADKLVVACTCGALGWVGLLPPWLVGVVIGRDVLLGSGALFALARGGAGRDIAAGMPPITPLYISKVNTVLQFGLIVGCLVEQASGGGLLPPALLPTLGVATAATTIGSLAAYTVGRHRFLPPQRPGNR